MHRRREDVYAGEAGLARIRPVHIDDHALDKLRLTTAAWSQERNAHGQARQDIVHGLVDGQLLASMNHHLGRCHLLNEDERADSQAVHRQPHRVHQ